MKLFGFEPYKGGKGKSMCPQCQKKGVFTKYIYLENGETINDIVGRCDRESKCGYNLHPTQYFKDNGINYAPDPSFKYVEPPIPPPSTIDRRHVRDSLRNYKNNNLFKYISSISNERIASSIFKKYHVGRSDIWGNSAIFWQVDIKGNVRTGKVMSYDAKTGKRSKDLTEDGKKKICFMNKLLKLENFHLQQCLFGEHLLASTDKKIGIVESEKTALICSIYFPTIEWLATGGLNHIIQRKMTVLRGLDVLWFPDLGAIDTWEPKISLIKGLNTSRIVTKFEELATDSQIAEGLDLEDFLRDSDIEIDETKFWAYNVY